MFFFLNVAILHGLNIYTLIWRAPETTLSSFSFIMQVWKLSVLLSEACARTCVLRFAWSSSECCAPQYRPVTRSSSPITGEKTAVALSSIHETSKETMMWANHMNHTWDYFLSSLTLNVYVGVSGCGSSGHLLVLTILYLWATVNT